MGIFRLGDVTFRAASSTIKSVAFHESPDEQLGHSPSSETKISIDGRTNVTLLRPGPRPNISINVLLVRNSGIRPSNRPAESATRTSKKVTGSSQPPVADADWTDHPNFPAASFSTPSRSEDPKTINGKRKRPSESKQPSEEMLTTARLNIAFRREHFSMLDSTNEIPITLTPLRIQRYG
jgi:hypothetical protein